MHHLLETLGVDRVGVDSQRITGTDRDKDLRRASRRSIRFEAAPKCADEGPDRTDRITRRVLPEVIDEHRDRHHSASGDQESRQDRAVPRAFQGDGDLLRVPCTDRSEDSELDAHSTSVEVSTSALIKCSSLRRSVYRSTKSRERDCR